MSAYLFQKNHLIPRSQVCQSHLQNYVSTKIDALKEKSHKSLCRHGTLRTPEECFVEENQTLKSVQQVKLKRSSTQ